MNKTSLPSTDTLERQWYLVDAENQTLGRLASEVASVLRGFSAPVVLDHRHHPRTARPRLEADRARSGVEVEETQPVERAGARLDG